MKDELIRNKYRILKTLGRNEFSDTFLVTGDRWISKYRRYVIKKFRPRLGSARTETIKRLFYREAELLQQLGHQNSQIPRLHECFTDGEDFYLVREWIAGVTLQQKVEQEGQLSVTEVEQILVGVLHFLEYVHSYGFVYRELKPSSFILRQQQSSKALPIPIYFGNLRELKDRSDRQLQMASDRDCQQYLAPEQRQGKLAFASDLYSLGLIAVYLLTGKNPRSLPRNPRTNKILWHQEIPNLKIHLVRVLDRAISPTLSRRYSTASEMLEALNSPPVNLALPPVQSLPHPPQENRNKATAELTVLFWFLAAGIGVLSLVFAISRLNLARDRDPLTKSWQSDRPISEALITDSTLPSSESLQAPIPPFPLGKPQQTLTNTLGEPTENNRGYWQNSRALLYKDVIPNQITLGYSVDVETSRIRQAEISFAGSVDLATIQLQAKELLQDNYSAEIKEYIDRVYYKTSDSHDFQANEIEGVVQRNPQNHIFLAIWDKEFH